MFFTGFVGNVKQKRRFFKHFGTEQVCQMTPRWAKMSQEEEPEDQEDSKNEEIKTKKRRKERNK